MPLPNPGVTSPNWGVQLNAEVAGRSGASIHTPLFPAKWLLLPSGGGTHTTFGTGTYFYEIGAFGRPVGISTLGVEVKTAGAGGTFECALYSYDPLSGVLSRLEAPVTLTTDTIGLKQAAYAVTIPANVSIWHACRMTGSGAVRGGTVMAKVLISHQANRPSDQSYVRSAGDFPTTLDFASSPFDTTNDRVYALTAITA